MIALSCLARTLHQSSGRASLFAIYSGTTMLFAISLCIISCDKAADLEQKVVAAQEKADTKAASAGSQAGQVAREAQAAADATIADATADFAVMREAYRHKTTLALAELDRRIAGLEATASAAVGAEKQKRETTLKGIRSGRMAFTHDYHALGTATGATWDATVVRLDGQLATLEALVSAA